MTTYGMPGGATNGDGPRNAQDVPLTKLNSASARSNASDIIPLDAQLPASRTTENVSVYNKRGSIIVAGDLAHLAFKVRDPPVARGPYYTTEVE
jgi:hypothetical protein